MADAKAVLADDKATQETVNAMLQSLVEAYGKLEKAESKVDKTKSCRRKWMSTAS